jgi:hypothetical protein
VSLANPGIIDKDMQLGKFLVECRDQLRDSFSGGKISLPSGCRESGFLQRGSRSLDRFLHRPYQVNMSSSLGQGGSHGIAEAAAGTRDDCLAAFQVKELFQVTHW